MTGACVLPAPYVAQLRRAMKAKLVLKSDDIGINKLTPDEAFHRAVALVDSYDRAHKLFESLKTEQGRRRVLSWRAFFVLMQVHFLLEPGTAKLEDVRSSATRVQHLWPQLGIKDGFEVRYHHIESYLEDLRRLFEQDDSALRFTDNGTMKPWRGFAGTNVDTFNALYLLNTIPKELRSTDIALDATHYESWAKPFSREKPRESSGGVKAPPKADFTQDADGRKYWSKDPEANFGHFTNNRPSIGSKGSVERNLHNTFHGSHLEVMTMVPRMGDDSLPVLACATPMHPGGAADLSQIARSLDAILQECDLDNVLMDRGYTNRDDLPQMLLERGLTKTQDLMDNQRVLVETLNADALFVDGWVYSKGMWDSLKVDLGGISRLKNTSEENERRHNLYEAREKFAYVAKTKPKKRGGVWKQELKGPAFARRVRCVNYPKTYRDQRLANLPETLCTPGNGCTCGASITIKEELLKSRQRNRFGTRKWLADYGRRSLVENYNSMIRGDITDIRRGYTRVFGTVKNGLLMTFAMAAVNLIALRRWALRRLLQDPYAVVLGENPFTFHARHHRAARVQQPAAHQLPTYGKAVAPPDVSK